MEILKYQPCKEAIEFRKQFSSFEEAWAACPRGDWMLWIAKNVNVDIRTLTLAKALCAKTVLHLMNDQRSIKAVQTALNFGKGVATVEELKKAADAAYAAAYAAYAAADAAAYAVYTAADAAAYAAYAAAYAAYAAYVAAYAAADAAADAAAYAAYAAADAAYAAADAAYATAKKENQLQTANICREILTEQVFKLITL